MSLSDRQRCEEKFHDSHSRADAFSYHIGEESACYKAFWDLVPSVYDKTVLDVGCGEGWMSLRMGMAGAKVFGIDISGELIKKATERARSRSVLGSVHFQKMTAEELLFPDRFFDIILGGSILHHVDIETVMQRISQVIKKDGVALFIEPLNESIVLKTWRFLTPWRRSTQERALSSTDLDLIRKCFPNARFQYFTFASIVTVGLLLLLGQRSFLLSCHRFLDKLDTKLVQIVPGLGRFCAVVVMRLAL